MKLLALSFIFVFVSPCWGQLNWDPGLTTRLAAYWDPANQYYFEACDASSNGQCYGTIPKGGGFYTLSYDATSSFDPPCTPNSGEVIAFEEQFANIAGQICPYYFYWSTEPYARIEINTLDYTVQDRFSFTLQVSNINTFCFNFFLQLKTFIAWRPLQAM